MIGGTTLNPSKATGGDYARPKSGLSYTDPKRNVQVYLPVDIVPGYKVGHRTNFTQYPISSRAIVSDHAIREGRVLEFTLHATNTPIDDSLRDFEFRQLQVPVRASQFEAGGFLALTNAVGAAASTALAAVGLGKGTPTIKIVTLQGPNGNLSETPEKYQDRINQLFEALTFVWSETLPCTFYANSREYKNLVITSFESVREGPAELGTFNVQCQEILFAVTGESSLITDPAEGRSGKKADKGSKTPDEEDPRLKSSLATIKDKFF